MDKEEFRKFGHELIDFIADYRENIERYPVKSQVAPREIFNRLPPKAPEEAESMEEILDDFRQIIMPGVTHWQHPSFFAYFPANASYPSLLGEMLMSALGAQCMIWDTSPAAAELEERVLDWLKHEMSLPGTWSGVIQDTASTATLCAILTAREKHSGYQINQKGLSTANYRIYCSSETHSSIEKAVKIAGIGRGNLVLVEVDEKFSIDLTALENHIRKDIADGLVPLCIIGTIGTTSTTGVDEVSGLSALGKKYNVFVHIDAAFAGTALILPEFRYLIQGLEDADSFVFNPHKWMFTNFDCTAYYVKDKEALIRTFSILPEYLKTDNQGLVNDYRDWGVPLGRRFRALKLWFVIRRFGMEGLREKIRYHISLAEWLEQEIVEHPDFELMAPREFSLVCFRWSPSGETDLDSWNEKLLQHLNQSGAMYLTHTKVNGQYTLRIVTAQTDVTMKHVSGAWEKIMDAALQLRKASLA